MSISFKVQGKPPKKDGSSSMWGKKSEALNIVNLRNAATEAMEENDVGPFIGRIGINLTIISSEKLNLDRIKHIWDSDTIVEIEYHNGDYLKGKGFEASEDLSWSTLNLM